MIKVSSLSAELEGAHVESVDPERISISNGKRLNVVIKITELEEFIQLHRERFVLPNVAGAKSTEPLV